MCQPRHTIPWNSVDERSKCVSMTWRAISGRPYDKADVDGVLEESSKVLKVWWCELTPVLKSPGSGACNQTAIDCFRVIAYNRPVSVYSFPRRALTLCPQLCMGVSPRQYTEIGLFHAERTGLSA